MISQKLKRNALESKNVTAYVMKAERLMQAWQLLPAIAMNTPYIPV